MGCRICSEIYNENSNEQIMNDNKIENTSKLINSLNNNKNYFNNLTNIETNKY